MRVRYLLCALVVWAVSARTGAAQDNGGVGLVMGYPGAVGVVWHVTERLALRPDVTLSRSTSESTTTASGLFPTSSTTTSTSWSTTAGLGALITVTRLERVRIYVAPRVAWMRNTSDNRAGVSGDLAAFDVTTTGLVSSASAGTEYRPHDHFAVFGELGLQYSELTTTSAFTGSRNRTENTSAGVRSAVGVTVYF